MKLKVWMGAAFAALMICAGSIALPAADVKHMAAADPIDPFVVKEDSEFEAGEKIALTDLTDVTDVTDLIEVPSIPFVTVTDPIDPI